MSTAKYTPLSTSDPDKYTGSLQFGTAFTYDNPHASGIFDPKKKFQSAFTFSKSSSNQMKIHAVETGSSDHSDRFISLFVTIICYIFWLLTFPVSGWFSFKKLKHYERFVVFRLGHLRGVKGPGVVVVLPFVDRLCKVDLRMKAFSVPPQKILTQDGAGIEVGLEVFYRIKDPVMSVTNIQDLNHSSRVIAQTVMTRQLGTKELSCIESQKQIICESLQNEINSMTLTWGVEVSKLQLSQVTVLTEPDNSFRNAANPLAVIGQVLFPSGAPKIPFANIPNSMGMPGLAGQSGLVNAGHATTMPAGQAGITPVGFPGMSGFTYAGTPGALPDASSLQHSHQPQESSDLSQAPVTPDDLIARIKPHLNSDLVNMVGYVYRFREEGHESNVFHLDLKNGSGSVGHGEPPAGEADVTLTLSLDLLNSLLSGETSALQAYMRGDLVVEGDRTAARTLSSLAEFIRS